MEAIEGRIAALESRLASLASATDQDSQLMAAAIEATAPSRGRRIEGAPAANPEAACWRCRNAHLMQMRTANNELQIFGGCRYRADVRDGRCWADGFGHKAVILDCTLYEVPE